MDESCTNRAMNDPTTPAALLTGRALLSLFLVWLSIIIIIFDDASLNPSLSQKNRIRLFNASPWRLPSFMLRRGCARGAVGRSGWSQLTAERWGAVTSEKASFCHFGLYSSAILPVFANLDSMSIP